MLVNVLHGTHGFFGSMDRILRPWIPYQSMEKGTFSWPYCTHLMGKIPPNGGTFPMDLLVIHGYAEFSWISNAFAT